MTETVTPVVGSTSNVATFSQSVTPPALAEKPEKFYGIDFKHWQQKMFFYLTTLSLQKFIKDVVSYKIEDAGLKKFVAAKCFYYKMEDSKPVITQVLELQVIIHDLLAEELLETQVQGDETRAEKKTRGNSTIMGANIVETAPTNPKKRKKSFEPNNYPSKKKFKGNCRNCEKVGHKDAKCCAPKKEKKKGQANMVETNDDINDLCAILSECNLVKNLKERWIDS
ncbi:uncharacterized protein [Nicotiana tomentosiformis]|uniref:uncharacterized protein n=1 Tax=Nicotiana tomentosiformis TaxID=4098 RepID=UPI00051C562D|nr:uncharacterized protein LOC104105792 [Nicotiana tomentosiformis]